MGSPRKIALAVLAVVALALALSACRATESRPGATSVEPTSTASETTPASSPPEPQAAPVRDVKLYFAYGSEASMGVMRAVELPADADQADIALAAARELVKGPTTAEKQTWPLLATEIPEGTKVLGVVVSGGVAKVDLSREFSAGGGSASMIMRAAQVVYTLCGVEGISGVTFYQEGQPLEVLGGEGLMIDGVQRPSDFEDLVPIEA